jgi:hypothetical protein
MSVSFAGNMALLDKISEQITHCGLLPWHVKRYLMQSGLYFWYTTFCFFWSYREGESHGVFNITGNVSCGCWLNHFFSMCFTHFTWFVRSFCPKGSKQV